LSEFPEGELALPSEILRFWLRQNDDGLVAAGVDDWVVGQEDAEGGAVEFRVGAAFEGDGAAVLGDDAAADPQAQASAAFPLGGEERLEEMAERFLGDSVADFSPEASAALVSRLVKT